MFGPKFFLAIAALVFVLNGHAYSGDDPWFYTTDEIAIAYKYQEQFGARLRHPLKPEECWYRQKEFIASYRGRQFAAPCRFISETIRQLKELRESGAAKYFFPLDVDHAHLSVPMEVWESKYSKMRPDEVLPVLLREPSLAAIYHTAQHLNSGPVHTGFATEVWGQKRTVLGFYDGRPNESLAQRSDGSLNHAPMEYQWIEGFTVLAHVLGELQMVVGSSVVMFDLSFDDDRAAAPTTAAVKLSARVK